MLQIAHNSGTEMAEGAFALEAILPPSRQGFLPGRSFRLDDPTLTLVHDLRNPLTAISGCAELLAAGALDGQQTKRIAANVWRASKQIQAILSGFVSMAKGNAEHRSLHNLCAVLSASCKAAGVDQRADIGLTMDVSAEIDLPMDRARMERVFLNLVLNALEVMPRGGAIHIAASATADQVRISVEDTGPGIPPVIRDRIFEPFATAGKPHGIGLGLAISRETVRHHGGELWTETGTASGARFVMCLPRFGNAIGQKVQQ